MSAPIKYAKYIPPEVEFKGNITKMKIETKVELGYAFVNRPMYFLGYFVTCVNKSLSFYNSNTYNLVFKQDFAEDKDDILSFNKLDDDTLIITNNKSARIIRFYENEPEKITFEVIQEIKETEFYHMAEKLSNGLLLLGGLDKKYVFYRLEHYEADQKVSKGNLYKKVGEIENVHNVYDGKCVKDLDNFGRNIKNIIVIDSKINIPKKYKNNLILIKGFQGDEMKDINLLKILSYILQNIKNDNSDEDIRIRINKYKNSIKTYLY